jgi:hypothetical protein
MISKYEKILTVTGRSIVPGSSFVSRSIYEEMTKVTGHGTLTCHLWEVMCERERVCVRQRG